MLKKILKQCMPIYLILLITSCGLVGSSGGNSRQNIDIKTPDIPGASFEFVGIVNVGDSVSLESFEYTTLDFDNQDQASPNKIYYYQFTATSEYTSITTLVNNSMDFEPGYQIQPCIFGVFNINGVSVDSIESGTDTSVYVTPSGFKYGVLVIPVITVYDGVQYKSDIIKFSISEYVNLNKPESTPSEVTVGRPYSGFFINDSSVNHYKLNLSAGSYMIETYNIGNIELTDSSGNSVPQIKYNSSDRKFILSSDGAYKMKVTNYDTSPFYDYGFFITDLNSIPTLTPSISWLDQNLSVFKSNYYKVAVDNIKDYLVSWKDKEQGGVGVNSACIEVSIYTDNNIHSIPFLPECVLEEEDNGFDYPHIVNFLPGTSEAILKINSKYSFSPGSYSFLFKENDTVINYETVNLGVETVSDIRDGDVRYYKFIIDQSKQYTFTSKFNGEPGFTGWAELDLYSANKEDYFIRNSSAIDTSIIFADPLSSNTELILKVNHYDSVPGTVGFMLEEVVPVP